MRARLRTMEAQVDTGDNALARYLIAVDASELGEYDAAAALVERNLTGDHLVGMGQSLLAWIAVKRERFHDAGRHFGAALSAIKREPGAVHDLARIVRGAIMIATDCVDLKLGARARAVAQTLPWTPGIALDRMHVLRGLRELSLLEGDIASAYVAAREAVVVAPTPPFVALNEASSATISRLLGDVEAYRLLLRRSWDILRAHRWASADNDEMMALPTFALEAAAEMPAEARKAMTLYRSLRARRNVANVVEEDRRVPAFEQWATARVAAAMGDRDDALRFFAASRAIWAELGHDVRVARIAIDVRRLIGGDDHRAPIEAVLRRAPKALIAGELEESIAELRTLRRAQLDVLLRLLEGYSAKAIGTDLGRSHFTVINHTRRIFAAFGVNSRDELFRRCAELGVTPERLRSRST